MKKLFTLIALSPLIAFGQSAQVNTAATRQANQRHDVSFPNPKPAKTTSNKGGSTQGLFPTVTIGTTNYNLQSNAAVARRLVQYSGNRMSAVWTTANDAEPWPSRGTGYNHFNGTSWTRNASATNARLENTRVGWPSVGMIKEGGNDIEYVLAHAVSTNGQAGGFQFGKNASVGSESFAGTTVLNDTYKSSEPGPIWNRSIVNGNKIYMIECFTAPSAAQPDTPIYNGVRRPNVYSIYNATTSTWEAKNKFLPDYDSVRYSYGNADAYSIDANGNTIAILIGGLQDDLAYWKSTDAGASWTRHVVDSFQLANKVGSTTPIPGNNGSVELLVDNAGHVHVFYSWLGNFYDTVVNGADARYVQYGTGINGIIHWSDYDDSTHYLGGMIDGNNDGTLDVGSQTRSRDWGGYGDALSFTQGGNNVTFAAITTMPSASIDASGKIFVTYTSIVEGDLSVDDENYRDIYVVWSGDNGKTWSSPQNITGTTGKEEIFPCQARMVDDRIRVMYQEQDDPGISVNQANNAAQSDMPIKYFEVMTADIFKGDIGVKGIGAISTFNLGQNQPNPANGLTTIPMNLFKTSDVSFTITDVTGKQILSENFRNMNAGTNYLTVDASSLSSGVYFYQVKAGSYSTTQKMIVE